MTDEDQRILPVDVKKLKHELVNVLNHRIDGHYLARCKRMVGQPTTSLIQVDEAEIALQGRVVAHGQRNAGIARTTMEVKNDGSTARCWIHRENKPRTIDLRLIDMRATANYVSTTSHIVILTVPLSISYLTAARWHTLPLAMEPEKSNCDITRFFKGRPTSSKARTIPFWQFAVRRKRKLLHMCPAKSNQASICPHHTQIHAAKQIRLCGEFDSSRMCSHRNTS